MLPVFWLRRLAALMLSVLACPLAAGAQTATNPFLAPPVKPVFVLEAPAAALQPTVSGMVTQNEGEQGRSDAANALRWAAYARYARDNPKPLDNAVRLREQFPEIADSRLSLEQPVDSAARAVALALVARNETQLKNALEEIKDPNSKESARLDATALKQSLEASLRRVWGETSIAVYADGNIRGVATGETNEDATGTGSLGVAVRGARSLMAGAISIASTLDTVTEGFGSVMLTPANGGSPAGLLDARRYFSRKLGVHGYGSLAESTWRFASGDSMPTRKALTIGIGTLAFYDIVKDTDGSNSFAFTLEGGLAARVLRGNLGNNEGLRDFALGTRGRFFPGLELGMAVSFNAITANIQYYQLWDTDDGEDVDGLTGGQLAAAISVSGQIFRTTVREIF